MPVIASDEFLTLTASAVGDSLPGRIRGLPVTLQLVGRLGEFPTADPAKPFVILDAPTLVLARYAGAGTVDAPVEWWLASGDPDATAAAAAALVDPQWTVTSRTQIERGLLGDPLALGVIGLLGLGVAGRDGLRGHRLRRQRHGLDRGAGRELALLRALGLSGGQLSAWLSAEHGLLLVAGLGGGVALGVLLAWLVLPFSTLTTMGSRPSRRRSSSCRSRASLPWSAWPSSSSW